MQKIALMLKRNGAIVSRRTFLSRDAKRARLLGAMWIERDGMKQKRKEGSKK
jgi:hypothetical protein